MQIDVHDVGHGACVVITSPEGNIIMIDCGHKSDPLWRPSFHYCGKIIDSLIISNLDEDHVSDLPRVLTPCVGRSLLTMDSPKQVKIIEYNYSVESPEIRLMKDAGGMGIGIECFIDWLDRPKGAGSFPDYGSVLVQNFYNSYPFNNDVTDSNNLSVVTVVSFGSFKLVTCGDIEKNGFMELLVNQKDALNAVKDADVLIAPHHGRDNGYDAEIVKHINPALVVFSDSHIQYDTQSTVGKYYSIARGAKIVGGSDRKVLTTRNDGHVRINVDPVTGWNVRLGV